jgi:hypothetical protein
MTVTRQLGTLLEQNASRSFVGRGDDLARLESLLGPAGEVRVVHVHGSAGIGKSALVTAFLERMGAAGAETIRLDCRSIEPTERGLLEALAAATGGGDRDVGGVTARLAPTDSLLLLALDHFEVFRLMDTWLRRVLVPALDDRVRVVLAGREPPVAAWFAAGVGGPFPQPPAWAARGRGGPALVAAARARAAGGAAVEPDRTWASAGADPGVDGGAGAARSDA